MSQSPKPGPSRHHRQPGLSWQAGVRSLQFKSSMLAAVLVISYAFFVPNEMFAVHSKSLFWAELVGWGGILVLTAYLVATLKARIQKALTDLQQAYDGVLAILSKFIQTVDTDTEAHCVRVSALAPFDGTTVSAVGSLTQRRSPNMAWPSRP